MVTTTQYLLEQYGNGPHSTLFGTITQTGELSITLDEVESTAGGTGSFRMTSGKTMIATRRENLIAAVTNFKRVKKIARHRSKSFDMSNQMAMGDMDALAAICRLEVLE